MKLKIRSLCMVLAILLIMAVICLSPAVQLHLTMIPYKLLTFGTVPDDMTLTIYYMDPSILTRHAYRADDLKRDAISGGSDLEGACMKNFLELEKHIDLLRRLDAFDLQPVEEKGYMNARLCYVFEVWGRDVLEVVMSTNDSSVFVNGIEVENNPIFLEIIAPFMPEEMLEDWIVNDSAP